MEEDKLLKFIWIPRAGRMTFPFFSIVQWYLQHHWMVRKLIPSTVEVLTIIGVSNFTRGNTNNLTLNAYKILTSYLD